MDADGVAAYARDRLGMDPQAIEPRRGLPAGWAGRVWWVMTEGGTFWLVEDGAAAELLLAAVPIGVMASTRVRYPTPARAVARFLELHPPAPRAAATPADDAPIRFTCRACGVEVSKTRPTVAVERGLCPRCRHLEREHERYHSDPEYRARRLAQTAAHYLRVPRKGPT
jgi:hypothetical protein